MSKILNAQTLKEQTKALYGDVSSFSKASNSNDTMV